LVNSATTRLGVIIDVHLLSSSGSLAILAAIRRASSRVTELRLSDLMPAALIIASVRAIDRALIPFSTAVFGAVLITLGDIERKNRRRHG
jgi:hypothetical protein